MTVASLFAELGVDTSPMSGVAREVESKMAPVRRTFQQVGSALTKFVTVPLAGVATAAAKTGIAIDDEFSRIEGLVGESRAALQGMRSDVFDIAAATGKGPEELAEALFFVESAGFRGERALSVLEASSKAATAGLGETKQVADAVTSAVNAYGKENLKASRAVDVLTATVREGKVEADRIASSVGQVIPVAAQMGVEFNEVGATLATLTRIGASSSRATTALAATLRTLLKGSDKTREGLDKLDLSLKDVQDRVRDDGLLPTLQLLKKRFDETGVAITDVFPDARSLRGVLGLIGKNGEQAEEIFASLNDEVSGATQKAFEAATQTISVKFNRALRTAQATLDSIFLTFKDQIIVVLDTAISVLEKMRGLWEGLSPTMQGVVVAAGAVAAALGPVLLGLTGIMAVLPSLISALGVLGSAAPVIAAVAGAGALLAANWSDVTQFFTSGGGQEVWKALKTGARAALEAVTDMTAGITDAVMTMWDAVRDVLQGGGGLIGLLADRLVTAFELVARVAVPVMDQVTNVVVFAANQIARTVQFIVDILTLDFAGAWEAVKSSVIAFGRFFARSLANMADVFLSWVETIVNTIPAVNVDFSGARASLRAFTSDVKADMEAARRGIEGPMRGAAAAVDGFLESAGFEGLAAGFETVKKSAESVGPVTEESLGAAVEAVDGFLESAGLEGIAAGFEMVRQSAKEAGQSAREAFQAAREGAPALGESVNEAFAQAGEEQGRLQNELDLVLSTSGEVLAKRRQQNEALQRTVRFFRRINEIQSRGGPSSAIEQAAVNPQQADPANAGTSILGLVPEELQMMGEEVTDFQRLLKSAVQSTKVAADQMIDSVGTGFAQLITQGQIFGREVSSLGDAFRALGQTVTTIIQKMITQLVAAIAKALIFKALTGSSDSVLSLAGGFLGGGGPSVAGARAQGGPVDRGKSYVVGENEPELFTPSRSGQVTPMSQMQGVRSSNAAVVKLGQPQVLPNGDLQFSLQEGGRQRSRRGFPGE